MPAAGRGHFVRKRWRRSVADGDAGDVGALQGAADGFGLVPLEPGEAGAVELAIVLGDDRLGEWIGLAEQAAGRAARGIDALLGLVLALERANLDDPAAMGDDRPGRGAHLDRLRRRIGRGELRGRRGGRGSGRQHAEDTVAGAEARRLLRQFATGDLGPGGFWLVDE